MSESDQRPENGGKELEAFHEDVRQIEIIRDIERLINWDQQVTMPTEGTPARSQQKSVLSALKHEKLVSEEMAEHLDQLEDQPLSDKERATVRELRRKHEREAAVSTDLVEEISQVTSEANSRWEKARENDDFERFAPKLEELVELKREYARQIDSKKDPYAVLFSEYAPYIDLQTAEEVIETLREELVPLLDELNAADVELANPFSGSVDSDVQEGLPRKAMDALGFDWDRGRLDLAAHPFCEGNQFDARVATRLEENDLLGTITGTIHEFGHALYEQGLPSDEYGSPLGSHRGVVVHESQARLWQNHVGHSEAFWEYFGETVNDHLDANASARELYEAANQIEPNNPIRVEADELTYHIHIIIRFEIERALISGDIDVRDIPDIWDEKMAEYLGIQPNSDNEGCLQDPHWSLGHFGYFPTYSLGSVLATQLFNAAEEDIGELSPLIRNGDVEPLKEWLDTNIYQYGQQYPTSDLIKRATGEKLTPDYFLQYARNKFGELYQI